MPTCSTYLEIGVQLGLTFEAVSVPFKWGVDPKPMFNTSRLPAGSRLSVKTSDDFFRDLNESLRFDLIFIDGLHEWRQAYRDLINAFKHASPQAIIVMDDVIPNDEYSAIPDQTTAINQRLIETGEVSRFWTGDVFKVIGVVAASHPELSIRVISEAPESQALIWRDNPQEEVRPIPESMMPHYDDWSYQRIFGPDGRKVHPWASTERNSAISDASSASVKISRSGLG